MKVNNNNNQKLDQSERDQFDLTGVFDMVSGILGESINDKESPQRKKMDSNKMGESITLNDIFNLSGQIMKDSNILNSLSNLSKKTETNHNEESAAEKRSIKESNQANDPFISGILNMVTGFINEGDEIDSESKVKGDIKRLRKRINKLEKDLLELKQQVNGTDKNKKRIT